MARDQYSEDGGSPLLNLNSILALLTLAGGIWFASQKLTSDRPVIPAGGARDFMGEQTLEARLWEDPFKPAPASSKPDTPDTAATNLQTLEFQISQRTKTDSHVLLLPVMISGGQYSEDHESRIRSRYAVISALGCAGFVPEDAEHLGRLPIPWPSERQLIEITRENVCKKLWFQNRPFGLEGSNCPTMDLRYEWYRPRVFYSHDQTNNSNTHVLVIWLDDSFFEDKPLVRLPLLLEPLIQTENSHVRPPTIRLIGPRRSSTLRAMLPGSLAGTKPLSESAAGLCPDLLNVLSNISVYCATPSAMDEVLVTNTNPNSAPRDAVKTELQSIGFAAFHNFAATDAQLAQEVFKELSFRNANPADTNNHLVLISEWDTFYARMTTLTYEAELARLQSNTLSRQSYVQDYRNGTSHRPANFHSLTYLRGLDGQTINDKDAASNDGSVDRKARKPGTTSIDDFRRWHPDVNRAEGQAQFDYLSRLGDRVEALQAQLTRESRGKIKAIGIMSSDVYDTLLILQAMRDRFSDVLFFTADLDARFWHPREAGWSRNLIVVSGYGLILHPDLQENIAPFRDSAQTAQFAATLAALGNTNLAVLPCVPVRCFEIGTHGAVDLSSTSGTNQFAPTNGFRLHPLTASEHYQNYQMASDQGTNAPAKTIFGKRSQNPTDTQKAYLVIGVCILLLGFACGYCRSLRNLTFKSFPFLADALQFSEEDVGGPDGAEALWKELRQNEDPLCKWMRKQLENMLPWLTRPAPPPPVPLVDHKSVSPTDAYHQWLLQKEKAADAAKKSHDEKEQRATELRELTDAWVDLLNKMCRRELLPSEPDINQTTLVPSSLVLQARLWRKSPTRWLNLRPLIHRRRARRFLDKMLASLTKASLRTLGKTQPELETAAALQTAGHARHAGLKMYRLRRTCLFVCWTGALAVMAIATALGLAIWKDTFQNPLGEPFTMSDGISAWPAQILRLAAIILAVSFSGLLYWRRHNAYLALTRQFRLRLRPPEKSARPNHLCAQKEWHAYWVRCSFWRRLLRISPPFAFYLLLGVTLISLLGGLPFSPLRGEDIAWWNGRLLFAAVVTYLLLTFLTIDATAQCQRFIDGLVKAPTDYPLATRRHFSRKRGEVNDQYLDEWIDLQLVAELTERVGRLVYLPFFIFFLLLAARNEWWDHWPWPKSLLLIFTFNLILAATSVIILQRAARHAKRRAEATLSSKIKQLQFSLASSPAENDASQAQQLLDEIRNLRQGAFAPIWQNPLVGALLLPSGGLTLLQVLVWFMGR